MNWAPFVLADDGKHSDAPRSIDSLEGVGDRLRAAAFAEVQAREAFRWAAEKFVNDVSPELREAWLELAAQEQKHLDWLLERMNELGIKIQDRKVSTFLWLSLISCKTPRDFALYMANAEERGRRAGERFHQALKQRDPESARIFGTIAEEEISHIELARRHFPCAPEAAH